LAVNRLSLAHAAYRLLLWALTPALMTWLWWRSQQDADSRRRLRERLGWVDPRPASQHGLWIHAASVGEVQAARPLIEALRRQWPDHSLTVTTQTPTGARQLHSHWGGALQHLFYPLDTPGATARFLDRLQPVAVILIERELWPEMLLQCRRRALPVALVNARLSATSAASYQRWAALMRPIWPQLARVDCADGESLQRLLQLGVAPERLTETGNLKFDLSPTAHRIEPLPWLAERSAVLVAGSTHEGEESALLAAWPDWVAQHPGAVMVLVPRHPQRFDGVAEAITRAGLALHRRSRGDTLPASASVYLADTMGELDTWYAHATVCFIGGSLVPIGGHNALEALALGKPVLFGAHTHNFQSLYDTIESQGLGQRVGSATDVLERFAHGLHAPAARQQAGEAALAFVRSQQGSSARSAHALQTLWAPLNPAALAPVRTQDGPRSSIWFNPQWLSAATNTLFEPPTDALVLATGSGRGQAHRFDLSGRDVVLRHYRRGGFMARFSRDRFAPQPAARSRAMAEFQLLRLMRAWGLPVPEPVAARQQRHTWGYTADIVVAMIPNTRNLVQALSAAPLIPKSWHALGRAIRQMHDRQVFHSDLNAHNLLLDAQGQAWIIDFDKCGVRPGTDWKAAQLARLQRSLHKEQQRCQAFHWQPASDWPLLMAGYQEA